MSPTLKAIFAAAAVGIATAMDFKGNSQNEFVRLDDYDYVCRNEHIREGLTPSMVAWAFKDAGYAANWHPLTWISHAFDVTVARCFGWDIYDEDHCLKHIGQLARLAHAENIALHAVNAALLFLLVWTILGYYEDSASVESRLLVAGFAALVWSLHPLRVEVVAWASERKELLSVFFMLLGILCYIWRRAIAYIISLVAFTFALLAKPVAISLPVVFFAWDWVILRRSVGKVVAKCIPFVALAVAAAVMTLLAQKEALTQGEEFSWAVRAGCALSAPIVYLRQTIWPFGLSASYPMPDGFWGVASSVGIVLVLLMVAACILWLMKPSKPLSIAAFAVAWCYIGLVPMLGIVKVGYQPHSDRYTYWVGCGAAVVMAMVFVWAAPYLKRKIPDGFKNCRYWLCGAVGILVLLSLFSSHRSRYWRSSLPLFADAVASAHLESDAWVLSSLMIADLPDGPQQAEAMARDVMQVRKSSFSEALLALVLAATGDPQPRVDFATGKTVAFEEARTYASMALADGVRCRHDIALAALGFIEYRMKNYAKAYDYMKQAYDAGYKCDFLKIDLAEWKRKADELGDRKDGKDV